MRNVFAKKIVERANSNKNVYLLTADLGYNCFEDFQKKFPERFINVGIAENNMLGIATGLAMQGKEVYVYSIIPFLLYKSFEHIKNYIATYNLNIKLIGAGGGFSYGPQGISHNPVEDLGVLNLLPNIKLMTPGTKKQTSKSIDIMMKTKGCFYIRLGKLPKIILNEKISNFKLGNPIKIKTGKEITIICHGNIIENVLEASLKLKKQGLTSTVFAYLNIKPLNSNFLYKNLNFNSKIFCVEEHSQIGGLGSIIANSLIDFYDKKIFFKKIAIKDENQLKIGSQAYLRKCNGLDSKSIEREILYAFKKNK